MAIEHSKIPARSRIPLIREFQSFVRLEAAGGILLLACAVLALLWANSPFSESYIALWQSTITVDVGLVSISKALLLWINDGLMAIFFFVVGLEIKREILTGELASPKKAALPLAGALGGMVLPATLYAITNMGGAGASGWGIPMATDIAFALGVLTLLGPRVPTSLKIFLTALAIVDDLGAVLVIAFFYTAELSWASLGMAGIFLVALIAGNRFGVRNILFYTLFGIGLWVAFLKSGVHATIAGVLLALTIPARRKIDAEAFATSGKSLMKLFAADITPGRTELTSRQLDVVHTLEEICEKAETPLARLEHALHPWVAFFIMPIFALANAGVILSGDMLGQAFSSPVTWGILFGLVLGKQFGVMLFAWGAVRLGWASLGKVTWRQLYGVAWLTGIGFTMSLFIANLAFTNPLILDSSKIGILTASLLSGLGGWLILTRGKTPKSASSAINA